MSATPQDDPAKAQGDAHAQSSPPSVIKLATGTGANMGPADAGGERPKAAMAAMVGKANRMIFLPVGEKTDVVSVGSRICAKSVVPLLDRGSLGLTHR